MPGRLNGKVALITGGSTGIGLATAKRFVEEGAVVIITGRRKEELEAAVNTVGPRATGMQVDSSVLPDLDYLYKQIQEKWGRIDILVVNAGGGSLLPLGSITEEQYEDTFGRNVKGVIFTVQKALPLLRDGASIILTGSTAGSKGTASFSVYSASKAAVRNFARSWLLDLKSRRIRVNTLSPGPVRTPGLANLAGTDPEQQRNLLDQLASAVPIGRMGNPEEVAGAAVFLASADSSFVNGIELFVDGGLAQI